MFLQLFTVFWFGIVALSEARKNDLDKILFANATPKNIALKDEHVPSIFDTFLRSSKLGIVNGQKATRGQLPCMTYLQFEDGVGNYWSCGGCLVSLKLILTAGHCVDGSKSVIVVMGALNLNRWEPGRQIQRVNRSGMKIHSRYDDTMFYNDIATLTLPKPAKQNRYVSNAKLPESACSATSTNNTLYTVSGWGKTSDKEIPGGLSRGGHRILTGHQEWEHVRIRLYSPQATRYEGPTAFIIPSDDNCSNLMGQLHEKWTRTSTLMYMNVPREDQRSCANYYSRYVNYNIKDSQMCTSGANGKSTCSGDSGGPVVRMDALNNTVVEGVVSLGTSSCENKSPSVHTKVCSFLDWINPQL